MGGRTVTKKTREKHAMMLRYVILTGAAFVAVFPYFWIFLSSIKPPGEMMSIPPKVIFTPTAENYTAILGHGFLEALQNSLFLSIVSASIGVSLSCMAAYGLTRFKFRGRETLSFSFFAIRFVPFITLLLPLYTIMGSLGLLNSMFGLIVAYQLSHIPWMTWLMRSFFLEIPFTYEDAGMVDGLTRWGVFFRIAVPMVAPAIGSALLLGIIFAWNQYFIPLILGGFDTSPLTVGLYRYVGGDESPMLFGRLAAWGTLTVTPVILLSIVVRKHLVRAFAGSDV